MTNFKKLMAGLMALGMVSTMGVSTFADTIGDSQKTFYTGDVNLDGKVTSADLLLLKKMILGLIPMQEMYIDGDTLKKVEETKGEEIGIRATDYTINVEDNTIHVTQTDFEEVQLDITLKVTDNTKFGMNNVSNCEEFFDFIKNNTIYLAIIYDSVTKEISEIQQVIYEPTLKTITTGNMEEIYYNIYPDEKRVHFEIGADLTELDLNITDTTVIYRNGETITFEEVSAIKDYTYIEISVEYDENTNNITKLSLFDIDSVGLD